MYEKPWLCYEVQLAQLESRGLLVTDKAKALSHLERIGYYRLSGYWYDFRERSEICCPIEQSSKAAKTDCLLLDTFKAGASFGCAVELYLFDKKLRLMTIDALERIEIALRVDVAHTLGGLDKFAYLKPNLFHPGFSETLNPKTGLSDYHQWLTKHAALINRSRETFIEHAKKKYGLPVSIWVACEVWDFGTLSTLFSGMRTVEQDQIAAKYGILDGRIFASWLRSLNFLRNVCAHHSRLWNRNVTDQPKLLAIGQLAWTEPFIGNNHARARSFLLICMVRHLLQVIHPASGWPTRMREHLLGFPDLSHLHMSLKGMGAIEGWQEWPMWQDEQAKKNP
jgi:abortive infection bacteriophage resistance protein